MNSPIIIHFFHIINFRQVDIDQIFLELIGQHKVQYIIISIIIIQHLYYRLHMIYSYLTLHNNLFPTNIVRNMLLHQNIQKCIVDKTATTHWKSKYLIPCWISYFLNVTWVFWCILSFFIDKVYIDIRYSTNVHLMENPWLLSIEHVAQEILLLMEDVIANVFQHHNK